MATHPCENGKPHHIDQVIGSLGLFYSRDHYPLQEPFDDDSFSQYYYHAHRGGEHGHFHLFLRREGMEEEMGPLAYDDRNVSRDGQETFAHLIAISMDEQGEPIKLFTTNRWVTGEDWYAAQDVRKMLKHFDVKHAYPSYVVNRWLKGTLVLFRPQIEDLIDERDLCLMKCREGVPFKEVLE
ncbi:MAG: hypothetical protein KDK60_02080, partial [Chlamydiia bacterium]|nr:hypothetical protein [Chlamydiia bacterium]